MPAESPTLDPVTPIIEEARKTASLKDSLAGVKFKVVKLLVFKDEEPVDAFAQTQIELAGVETRLGDQDLSVEDRAFLKGRLDTLEKQRDDKRAEMLKVALAIHMARVPDVVVDAGRRAARKAYAVDGAIPDELLEDANALQQRYMLGRVIRKVVDADGTELEFDRDEMAQDLREALPFPQWQRVVRQYNEIVFTDQIGTAAVLEPGF